MVRRTSYRSELPPTGYNHAQHAMPLLVVDRWPVYYVYVQCCVVYYAVTGSHFAHNNTIPMLRVDR